MIAEQVAGIKNNMVRLSFIILLFFLYECSIAGSKYYFASSGSNANSCSLAQPCQTLVKLNSLSLVSGDSVFLNRGDIFYGNLVIKSSGVYVGDYGSGTRPVVTGFSTLTGWSSLGGGIYQTACSGCNINTNMLLMNGIQQPLCRYPNTGWLSYESFSGTTSITDNQLTGTPNWTNGYVAIRNNNYTLTYNLITNHSGTTITYTAATNQTGSNNYGYFIINDSLALDTLGEWFYSVGTGNMKMYFGGNSPSSYTIQTTTQDTLVNIQKGLKNITVNNLDLEGGGIFGVYMNKDTSISISNCTIKYMGGIGCWSDSSSNSQIVHSFVQYCNDNGIAISDSSKSFYIGYDTVDNAGTMPGQGRYLQKFNYNGIRATGFKAIAEYNKVDTCGYDGISAYNDSSINNNAIDYFCYILDDGGGIYHLGYTDTTKVHNILNNTITNGIGAPAGTNNPTPHFANGIYVDQNNFGVQVKNNTVSTCGNAGIYFHNTRSSVAMNNTIYNCKYQFLFQGDITNYPIKNDTIKKNIFAIGASNQDLLHFDAFNGIRYNNSFGVCDSNYYAYTDIISNPFYTNPHQTYNQWGDSTSDRHSILYNSPIDFKINNTGNTQNFSLTNNCRDVFDVKYAKTISVSPYSSILLLLGGFLNVPNGAKPNLH